MPQIPFRFVLELERIFSAFNKNFFKNSLSCPTHVISSDKKVVFRFCPGVNHLVIGTLFPVTGHQEMLEAYLHEMVHIFNHFKGIDDCTSNHYHNKNFLAMALKLGFHVKKHKNQGWSITTFSKQWGNERDCQAPGLEARSQRLDIIDSLKLDVASFVEGRKEVNALLSKTPPKPCFLKYVCQCKPPHNSIRSGRRPDGPNALHIKCDACGEYFQCVE